MQNFVMKVDQGNRFITESANSNARGKDMEQEVNSNKVRKMKASRKAKLISTGHRVMQTRLGKKRGNEEAGEKQVGGKKLRKQVLKITKVRRMEMKMINSSNGK